MILWSNIFQTTHDLVTHLVTLYLPKMKTAQHDVLVKDYVNSTGFSDPFSDLEPAQEKHLSMMFWSKILQTARGLVTHLVTL